MKRGTSIHLTAAFLFVAFAMNTVVGFARANDKGFYSKGQHDNEVAEAVMHIHKDGKNHNVPHEKNEMYDPGTSYHRSQGINRQIAVIEKGDTCNGQELNLEQPDKTALSALSVLPPVITSVLPASFYNINILSYTAVVIHKELFIRAHRTLIQDIAKPRRLQDITWFTGTLIPVFNLKIIK